MFNGIVWGAGNQITFTNDPIFFLLLFPRALLAIFTNEQNIHIHFNLLWISIFIYILIPILLILQQLNLGRTLLIARQSQRKSDVICNTHGWLDPPSASLVICITAEPEPLRTSCSLSHLLIPLHFSLLLWICDISHPFAKFVHIFQVCLAFRVIKPAKRWRVWGWTCTSRCFQAFSCRNTVRSVRISCSFPARGRAGRHLCCILWR